jgi:hypothetical protein
MKPIVTYFIFVLFCLSGHASYCQQVNAFTARQAVDYAMKNSTTVINALLDIQAQKQTNRDLTALAYPQIQSSVQVNDFIQLPTNLIPGEFNGGAPGTYTPIQFGTRYNVTGTLNFSQLLFDAQVFVGLQARRASLEFYTQQADVTREMIKANVYKLYYQLVVGNQQMGSMDANIDRFEKLLSDTRQIFKNGFAEKLDVDKVSVQLNNLKTEKIRIQSQLDAGYAALKFLMNMPQQEKLLLVDSVSEEMLAAAAETVPLDYANRKEYKLLETGCRLSAFNVKRYKLSALPTLAAFASYNQNAQRNKFDVLKAGGSWYPSTLAGLSVQMPLFNGMQRRSRLEKARIEWQKAQNSLTQLKQSIDNEVVQASLKRTSALATVESQRENMKLAEQVYLSSKLKYEQGLGSQQEIYNAQTELKVAQNNYYGALFDAVISSVDYKKATGTLD